MNNAQASYLDALRASAAQIVLLGHIYSIVLRPDRTLGIGDLGVAIFFILSGFLIGFTTFAKSARPEYGFKRYLQERFCRIFVPYLPALGLILLLDTLVFSFTETRTYQAYYTLKDFVASLLMLQQHPAGLFLDQLLGMAQFKLSTFSSGRPLWTVAVEWWLYLTFGLILFGLRQLTVSPKWLLALLFCAAIPLFNTIAGTGAGLSLIWGLMCCLAGLYYRNQTRVDSFFIALDQAPAALRRLVKSLPWLLLALALGRLLWTAVLETRQPFTRVVFYDFNLYAILVLLAAYPFLIRAKIRDGERNRLARFTADYSYSLYLIHYSLIFALHAAGLGTGKAMLDLALYFVLCNAVAIAFWYLFERNYRLVGQRLFGHPEKS